MPAAGPGEPWNQVSASRLWQLGRQVRVPWRVQNWWNGQVSTWHYLANRFRHRQAARGRAVVRPRILVAIPDYGFTGGAAAMLAAADLLSCDYDVCYRTDRRNVMNRYVGRDVRMIPAPDPPFEVCLIESGEDPRFVEAMIAGGARIVVAMHGDPDKLDGSRNHGYTTEQMARVLGLADSVQYISATQTGLVRQSGVPHARLIPNAVRPLRRPATAGRTGAVGFVGDSRQPHKNLPGFLRAAEASSATHIEIWGRNHGQKSTGRVRWNGFSTDKERIFGSFDVLAHLSLIETQPLVVLEALSAGVPCVLSDLPNYGALRHLKGVTIVDPDDHAAAARAIDAALACPEADREALVEHWRAHHSEEVIRAQWLDYLNEVMTLRRRLEGNSAE